MIQEPWMTKLARDTDATSLPGLSLTSHTVSVPSRDAVIGILSDMLAFMFPSYFSRSGCADRLVQGTALLAQLYDALHIQIRSAYRFAGLPDGESDARSAVLARSLLERLPKVKETLLTDISALYEGDPAAVSPEEVLLSYPGFYAIAVYRLAHEFYLEKIPYLSRLMTEHAHGRTGIDIHAGATVGRYFFIDHGTGTVIGETTTIGDHVKIYQGVTLGAKSFELDDNGNPVKGIKRHPDIGNRVVIYANATILGGSTHVGDDCVIGGNVWLTHSVPAGQVIYYGERTENNRK